MPSYTFCDKDELAEHVNAVPIEEILGQYRYRYLIHTEKCGTIVLKYLSYRLKKAIDVMRNIRYPNIKELEEEVRILYPIVSAGECEKEQIDRLEAIAATLRPATDMYMLGCIEYPFISHMDDLDAILEVITNEEREVLMSVMEILTAPLPPVIDAQYLEVCDRFRVPIVDRDMMLNISAQEYEALQAVIKQGAEETKKAYRQMGVKV